MSSRHAQWAICLLGSALLTGCHAGGVGNLAAKPEPSLPKVSLTATEAIEKHNLNASRIQRLDARPKITVSGPINSTVEGRMALEQPRNFKLQMFKPMGRTTAADIGSNDDEFWFWTTGGRGKDNPILVCSYEDIDRSRLSTAFQPEWIIEAMGLRSISRQEAAAMSSKPGDVYGTVKLTSTRRGSAGESLTKETIIDPSTGQIKEHRLFQGEGGKKSLIAQAVISEYQSIKLDTGETVVLPYHFKLEWMQERLALEILLDSPKLNPTWNADERQVRFTEPEIPGSKRVNLADYAPANVPSRASTADPAPRSTSPRSRSTRSAPAPGGDIRLGAPEPFGGNEGASRTRDRDQPVAFVADSRYTSKPSLLDQVVTPDVPHSSSE